MRAEESTPVNCLLFLTMNAGQSQSTIDLILAHMLFIFFHNLRTKPVTDNSYLTGADIHELLKSLILKHLTAYQTGASFENRII